MPVVSAVKSLGRGSWGPWGGVEELLFRTMGGPTRRGGRKAGEIHRSRKHRKGSRRKWVEEEDGKKVSTKEGRKGGGRREGKGASIFACSARGLKD